MHSKHLKLLILMGLSLSASASLEYSDLERLALVNNYKIKQQTNQLKSAKLSRIKSLRDLWIPQFSFKMQVYDQDVLSGFTDDLSVIERSKPIYLSTLSANYNLFNGLGDLGNYNYYKNQEHYEEEGLTNEKMELLYKLRNLYYDLSQELNRLDFINKELERDQEFLRSAKIRFQKGLIPKTDLKRREIELDDSEGKLSIHKRTIKNSYLEIEKLVGEEIPRKITPLDYMNLEEEVMNRVKEIERFGKVKAVNHYLKLYLNESSELKMLAHKVAMGKANYAKARSNFLPKLSIQALHSYAHETGSSESDSLTLGITMSLPLFDSFDTMIAVKKESLELQNSKLAISQEKLEAKRNLQRLCNNLIGSYNSFKSGKKKLRSRQYIYRMMTKRFHSGAVSTKDLIEEEILLEEELFSVAQASYRVRKNYLAIEKMIGTLWGGTHK